MTRILIVEDDAGIADYLARGLEMEGFETDTLDSGHIAADAIAVGGYQLVILDLGLPGANGFEIIHQIRSSGIKVPVIVLSARTSLNDRVTALQSGANDYMPKPFQLAELLARIQLRLAESNTASSSEHTELRYRDLLLDVRTQSVLIGDKRIELTRREMRLMETFLEHPQQMLSREKLYSLVWEMNLVPGSNVVDVYVRSLRKKIGAGYIETVRGSGYRLK